MCLILTHHADTVLDEVWIHNFWYHNSDGIGVMYADKTEHGVPFVATVKTVARTEADAWAFYQQHIKGRECVVHFRMATHGDINEDQVHPYVVAEDEDGRAVLSIMHNGVLACGNSYDKTKSDTWHFTRWYLKPLLDPVDAGHPDLLLKDEFVDMLGTYIGPSNRFVFMDDDGRVTIINEHEGVRWRGMWLANTYAWDAPSHLSKYKRVAEAHTLEQDLQDLPPDNWESWNDYKSWTNYRDFTPATTATKGAVVVAGSKPAPSNVTKITVASNGTGKETTSASIPFGRRNVGEWMMNQFDGIFDMLEQERLKKAWAQLTYADMAAFEQDYDLDQLWDAIYMGVDGIVTEDRLIDIIKKPKQYWSNEPARQRHVAASVRHEDPDADLTGDEILNPDYDEVIEATLPRRASPDISMNEVDLGSPADHTSTPMPETLADGRPVFDNKEVI